MKRILVLVIFSIFCLSQNLISQSPPPPPGTGHGDTNNIPGGGAPIGSGVLIFLGLGAAYGGKKIIDFKKEHH